MFLKLTLSSLADPLSSYKHKDDLVILAGAPGLNTIGTVSELSSLIKSHLSDNTAIQLDPCFAGLFLQNKQCHVDNSDSVHTNSVV